MKSRQPRIAVIGGGIVGLATAYALTQQGYTQVQLFEHQYIGNSYAASRGDSRLLRFDYGTDRASIQLVEQSLAHWLRFEQHSRQPLFTSTGVLTLAREQDTELLQSYETLLALGYPVRELSERECQHLFPGFQTRAYDLRYLHTRGGMLHVTHCLRWYRQALQAAGVPIREYTPIVAIDHQQSYQPIRLVLESGDALEYDRVIVAVGNGIGKLLPQFPVNIRVTSQFLWYFARMPEHFRYPQCPAFLAGDLYGFPIADTGAGYGEQWLKVASHTPGPEIDPEQPMLIDPERQERVFEDLCMLLPELRGRTPIYQDLCTYDNSPDGQFVIDHYPYDERIIVATGMSGHAFKFAPVLGELIASLVEVHGDPAAHNLFCLDRFSMRAG